MFVKLLFQALGWWRWIKALMGQVVRWICASPARIWAAVALVALLGATWQYQRAARFHHLAQQTRAAFDAARAQAEAARLATEARYRSLAHEADQAHAQSLAQGHARLAAYIAAHRLQPAAEAHPASPAQDRGAPLSDLPPAETVLATMSDLHACDADYAYAQAAHEWAARLNP